MFELNSKFYEVRETTIALSDLKGVVVFNEWLDVAKVGQTPFISASYMLPFTFTEWTESSLEGIDDLIIYQEANWLPYDKEQLPRLFDSVVSLADRRLKVQNEIRDYRSYRTSNGGYPASGKWFHSDSPSRIQQISLYTLGASLPAGINWKTMDGSFIEMTPTLAAEVFFAAMTQDVTTFAAAEFHVEQVDISDNPEAYDYSAGWPTIFGE